VSRVGRKPITIAQGVKVQAKDHHVTITGPKGELSADVHPEIALEVKDNRITVTRSSDVKEQRALHGLWRALLQNMVKGVTEGYTKKLELVGVGYRAELKGKKLQLALGYSHPILFEPPTGIKIETPSQTNITISGIDKQLVGQVAAQIRAMRKPDPYKQKGVRYTGEVLKKKAGKTGAK